MIMIFSSRDDRAGLRDEQSPSVDVPGPDHGSGVRADTALLNALARALPYRRLLDEGQYASITEMAEAEKLDRGYMGRLLQLTLLAPEIVEAVLNGRQAEHPDLPSLMKPLPVDWEQQGSALA